MIKNKLSRQKINNYRDLLSGISRIITDGRNTVIRQINATQVITYWLIGRRIVEFHQKGKERAIYGERILKQLAGDLSTKYGQGFSKRNLEMMRLFYLQYPIAQTLSAQLAGGEMIPKALFAKFKLSWSHYCELLKEDDLSARSFYEIEAAAGNWSVRELKRQMNSMLYERLALSRDKKKIRALARRGQLIAKPEDAIKDPYIFEFLGLQEKTSYNETDLEQAIIEKLQHFLLELGKGFTFIARQKRITINNRHYYIDLVFYNRLLKCFVLVDIKRGELDHADAGQMNFYLNYFKTNEMAEGDNHPIGIILCSKKDEIFAKYVLGNLNNRIFASKYKLALPSEKDLDKSLRLK